ncbi:hypothetical protein evm_009792 [Chilo suppressalis]|nr:hypothetical protein evm_009792 [Chilo suppressalis]
MRAHLKISLSSFFHNAPKEFLIGLRSFVYSPDEENRMLKLNVMNDIQYFITGVPFAGPCEPSAQSSY